MSYMIVKCPACGEVYDVGVVGTTMIGGHQCKAECLCSCGHDHQHCPCECRSASCRFERCDPCRAVLTPESEAER